MFVKGFMTGLLESLFTMLLNISAIRLNDKSGSSQEEKVGKLWKKKWSIPDMPAYSTFN